MNAENIYMYLLEYKKTGIQRYGSDSQRYVNPMRFFTYQADGMKIRDEKYIPKPQKQQRGDRGEVKLNYDQLGNDRRKRSEQPKRTGENALAPAGNRKRSELGIPVVFGQGVSSHSKVRINRIWKLAKKRTDSTLKRIFGF